MKECSKCGFFKKLNDFYKDKRSRDGHESRCIRCRSEYFTSDNHKKSQIKWREQLRNVMFDHYGHECTYCGSTTNLQFDHINGDGGGNNKRQWTTWANALIKTGFPDGCQVLCGQCNVAKQNMTDAEFRKWILGMAARLNQQSCDLV